MKADLKKRLMGLLLAVAVTVPNTGISLAAPLEVNVTEDEVTTDGALSVGDTAEDGVEEDHKDKDSEGITEKPIPSTEKINTVKDDSSSADKLSPAIEDNTSDKLAEERQESVDNKTIITVDEESADAPEYTEDRETSDSAITAMATGDFSYAVEGGNIYYDSYGQIIDCDETVTSVVIPKEINGVKITNISWYAFQDCRSLISISLPEGITSIGGYAFSYCSSLTNINLPEGITSIGKYAFYNCSSLSSISLPKEVISIGEGAFNSCSSLSSVSLPEGITNIDGFTFRLCSNLTSINIPEGVTSIGEYAFCDCNSLSSISLPERVTSIGAYTFYGCSNLISITLPNSVTSIGEYAFSGCSSLTSVVLSENLTSLTCNNIVPMFDGCNNLKEVTLPQIAIDNFEGLFGSDSSANSYTPRYITNVTLCKNVNNLNGIKCTFSDVNYVPNCNWNVAKDNQYYTAKDGILFNKDCTELISCYKDKGGTYTIPNTVSIIHNMAFADSSLSSVVIPDSVSCVKDYAFSNSSINKLTLGKVEEFGYKTFEYCRQLTDVKLSPDITVIGECAFYGCVSLREIEFPESITDFKMGAFLYCINLEEVNIPEGTKNIEKWAFSDCYALKSIVIPQSVETIGEEAFYGAISLTDLSVGQAGVDYKWTNEYEVIDNSYISTWVYTYGKLDNVVILDGVTSIGANSFSNINFRRLKIPDTVTNISNNAFSNLENLEEVITGKTGYEYLKNYRDSMLYVTLLNGIDNIEDEAFKDCLNLSVVFLSDRLSSIGNYAFSGCYNLKSFITFGGLTDIGDYAFENCRNLTNFSIPGSVTNIGNYAFYDCDGLKNINLPSGLKNIGDYAFYFCDGLTSVTIPDSVDYLGGYAFAYCDNLTDVNISDSVTTIGDHLFYHCNKLTTITIPGSVTAIGDYAFAFTNLTDVDIPDSVTTIGNSAFSYCSGLATITIPDGVTSIGDSAFNNCQNLTGIIIPSSVTNIGNAAFKNCSGRFTIYAESGSYAEEYAKNNGYKVANEIPDGFGAPFMDMTVLLNEDMNIGDSVTLKTYSYAEDSNEPFIINWTNSAPEVINLIPDTTVTTSYDRYYYKAKAVAIGEGTATITAEASNGSVLTYTFNVVKKPIKIEKLTVNGGSSLDISKDYTDIDIRLTFTEDVVLNKEGVTGNSFVLKDSETATDVIASQMISGENVTQVDSRTIRVVFPDTQLSGSGLSRKYLDVLFSDAITPANADCGFNQDEVFPVSFALTDGTYKYGVSVSNTTDFRTAAQQYMTALEAYEKSVRSGLAKEYPEVDSTGYTRMIPTLDSLLVGEENIPAEAKEACRRALFEALKNINNSNLEIKDKYSSDKEQFTLNILNEVIKKLNNVSYVFDDAGYEYRATAHLTGIGREFFGEVTYEKKNTQNGNVTGTIGVSKDPDMVADAIATYATDLCELGNTAVNNFVCTVFDEYSKVFGLDKYLEDKLTFDINSVPEEFTELAKIYNDSSDICNAIEGVINSATPADTYFTAQELHDIAMNGNVFEKPAQCSFNAYTQLKKARDVLIECANYYIAHNEMPEIPVSTVANWLKKLVFNCPVDLYVYGEDGSLLGYISGDEVVVQSDAIALEKTGDQKILYLLTDEPVTYRLSAYDYGMLNITEETMSDGEIIARSNYYDIPLDVNDELISNEISPDREKHSLMTKDGVITSDTDLLVSDDAAVNISVQGENGRVSGGGTYVAGDRVTIMASPEEGYSFGGWYEGDTLVSIQNMYAFVASKDISLRAEFNEIVLLEYLYGDANADGLITASDCAAVLQKVLDASFVTGIEASGGDYMTYLDVSDDNKLTAADASIILQKTLDNSFKMPCEG